MIPYFGGADTSYYREFLHEHGVRHVSFNWLNHQRRIRSKGWVFADHFPPDTRIFVDSGAAAYNREGVSVPYEEVRSLYSDYYAFIELNYDRIDGFLEFDAKILRADDIDAPRHNFRRQGQFDKIVPVWHADTGEDELMRLALGFQAVAVAEKRTEDNQLDRIYRAVARHTNLHLIGADRTLLDAHIKWSSCHFSAWYASQQHGEIFVWVGHQLRRYTSERRETAMKRHAGLFETLGLDLGKLKAGDPPESLRLSIWSWSQYFANLENRTASITQTVTESDSAVSETNADPGPSPVAETDPEWRHDLVTQGSADPVESALSGQLPAPFTDTTPLTKEHRGRAYDYLIRLAEWDLNAAIAERQAQGGYWEKNVGTAMDRMARLLKAKDDMDTHSFSLTIKAQQKGDAQVGLLSRLFGGEPEAGRVGDQSTTAEASVVGPAIEPMTVLEAEVVSESFSDDVTG